MRLLLVLLALLGSAIALPATAQKSRDQHYNSLARCSFTFKGKTYVSGNCNYYYSLEHYDGGLTQEIIVVYQTMRRLPGYFFYIYEPGKTASDISWNADPHYDHAQRQLGVFQHKGHCWTRSDAKLCLRPASGVRCTWDEKSPLRCHAAATRRRPH
jgi:hypothetical protein